jgi:hypothetical protein
MGGRNGRCEGKSFETQISQISPIKAQNKLTSICALICEICEICVSDTCFLPCQPYQATRLLAVHFFAPAAAHSKRNLRAALVATIIGRLIKAYFLCATLWLTLFSVISVLKPCLLRSVRPRRGLRSRISQHRHGSNAIAPACQYLHALTCQRTPAAKGRLRPGGKVRSMWNAFDVTSHFPSMQWNTR